MSELKATTVYDAYWKANSVGEGTGIQVYIKSEADKVIADLEESHKMEVEQLLMEIVELKKQVHDYGQGLYVMQAKAEMETRHQKYKRCLAMAKYCDMGLTYYNEKLDSFSCELADFFYKWYNRWWKLAEKFKERK